MPSLDSERTSHITCMAGGGLGGQRAHTCEHRSELVHVCEMGWGKKLIAVFYHFPWVGGRGVTSQVDRARPYILINYLI